MALRFAALLVICLVGSALCQKDEACDQLYSKVFRETTPHLERFEVMRMLKDLKEIYSYKEPPNKAKLDMINQVLEDSIISESKCSSSVFMHTTNWIQYPGRASELVGESRYLQAKLCLGLWEESLLPAVASLGTHDKEAVSSIIKSMIKANGGKFFAGKYLQMPYDNAQEGVLRYMEKKTRSCISKKTKEDKFNEAFDKWISEPCERILNKLLPLSNRYFDVSVNIKSNLYELNTNIFGWSGYALICQYLRGSGFTSSERYGFKEDMFRNLAYRKSKGCW